MNQDSVKVFIIAVLTADGFIAKSETQFAGWSSKEDKKRFVELTKRARAVVMGSRTFETLSKPLPDRLTIVYTRSGKKYDGAETTSKNPLELIHELQVRGYEEIAICGGASIYTLFMRAGIVSSLYLTIEPIVFGSGIKLFTEPIDATLELVSLDKTPSGTVFLEYRILPKLQATRGRLLPETAD